MIERRSQPPKNGRNHPGVGTCVEVGKVTRLNQATSAIRIAFCEAAQRCGQRSEPGAMSIVPHLSKPPGILGDAGGGSSFSGSDQPPLEFGKEAAQIR